MEGPGEGTGPGGIGRSWLGLGVGAGVEVEVGTLQRCRVDHPCNGAAGGEGRDGPDVLATPHGEGLADGMLRQARNAVAGTARDGTRHFS